MSLSFIDILFLITALLLVFQGLRNGAVFSLVSLLGIPVGLIVASMYGPQFTTLLAANGLSATPLIAYGVLFFGAVFVVHIIASLVRGIVKSIPLISQGDTLIGGAIGFVEAYLLWLTVLILLGSFLGHMQSSIVPGSTTIPGVSVQLSQFTAWHNFYNQVIMNSTFARVNGFFVKFLPGLPVLQ
ncbi:MAG TPA: CvpA family protein [Dictyobacter sp.]|nr:CvpA family protein [Dictyobacter sp.]